jgi:hypothetical protein
MPTATPNSTSTHRTPAHLRRLAATALALTLALAAWLLLTPAWPALAQDPGGVNPNLQLWLKANAGANNGGSPAANGQDVTTWLDQGPQSNHATQGTATRYAEFQLDTSNATRHINFNPVLEFDETAGQSDQYVFSTNFGIVPSNDFTIISVQRASINGFDTYLGNEQSGGTLRRATQRQQLSYLFCRRAGCQCNEIHHFCGKQHENWR